VGDGRAGSRVECRVLLPHNRSALIVGADVAGELVGVVIAKRLKEERARVRRDRDRLTAADDTNGAGCDGSRSATRISSGLPSWRGRLSATRSAGYGLTRSPITTGSGRRL